RGGTSSTSRRANGRCPEPRPPFSAGGVLVGTVDGAVEAVPFVITVALQRFEQAPPPAASGPAIKSIEDRLPRPKLGGHVSPCNPSAPPPKNRFNEVPIVSGRSPSATF